MAQKWYRPVNIGHVYLNFIAEKKLSEDDANANFVVCNNNIMSELFKGELQELTEEWKKNDKGSISPNFQNDPYFTPNRDYKIDYSIDAFSDDSINVKFFYEYGTSRWHHYNALLMNLIIPRNSRLDSIFNMEYYESLYKTVYNGIGHDSTGKQMEEELGTDYFEYFGQSLQLRNVYYEDQNLEICLQDGIVKFVKIGRPGWMDSDNITKHKKND
ncbi:MAG: hypothetical protein JW794_10470 [Candidatus Cloacimonetes bacterium]|nr:hypothetical protein [Candidatus Cloacimonadota bacterium]